MLYRIAARIALGFTKRKQPILGMVFAGEVDAVGKAKAKEFILRN
jgi:hypothetical protein